MKAQPTKEADKVEPMPLESRLIEIVDRRRALERRLDDGYVRIEEALRAGTDVTAWEDFWLALLADYEHVCEEPRRAA